MRFLFIFGQSQKVGEAHPTEESVVRTFRLLYEQEVRPEDKFLVQEYSEMFDDYVDVGDFTTLVDRRKLRFVKKDLSVDHTSEPDSSEEDEEGNAGEEDEGNPLYPEPRHYDTAEFRQLQKAAVTTNNDDLPCPCRAYNEQIILYNMNKGIRNRGVGLLCFKAHPVDSAKVNAASRSSWVAYCIRAYPNRAHLLPPSNCQSMKEAARLLRGMVSGGDISRFPQAVGFYIDSAGYVICEEPQEWQPPTVIRVPTVHGFVFLRSGECEVIWIHLSTAHCRRCQRQ